MVIGLQDGRLQVRHFKDGYLAHEFVGYEVGEENRFSGIPISFSPDGSQFVYLSKGIINFVRTTDWSIERKLALTFYDVTALSFSSNEPYLAAAGSKVWIWPMQTGQPAIQHEVKGNALAFSFDGRELAIGTDEGQVGWVWMDAPERIRFEQNTSHPIEALTFLANNRYLLTANEECTLQLWDAQTGKYYSTVKQIYWPTVHYLQASRNGRLLIVGPNEEDVPSIYDLSKGLTAWSPFNSWSPKPFLNWIFSADEHYAALIWYSDVQIKMIDLINTEDPDRLLWGRSIGQGSIAAFSADSRILAVGADTGEITLYSVPDGKMLTAFAGHQGQITGLSFSSDGRWLASGSDDGTIRLWGVVNSVSK